MSEVTVYGKPGCRACEATKRRLKKQGVEFNYVDFTQDETAAKLLEDNGVKAAPYVTAPTGNWSGLDEAEIDKLVASL